LPGPASTPGHDVTSAVICWLAVGGMVLCPPGWFEKIVDDEAISSS
jgi:hypothetical protein